MLLGQNVNSYSADINFPTLLSRIAEIEGDFIIRFMTSHPKDAGDELIEVMAKYSPKTVWEISSIFAPFSDKNALTFAIMPFLSLPVTVTTALIFLFSLVFILRFVFDFFVAVFFKFERLFL